MALTPLAPGVHAWLADDPGPGRPNAGAVVDEDGVTVVDTLLVPSQTEPFALAVEALGPPVRRVVLTSSHIEYVGGTGRFRLTSVAGTAQASAHLDQPPNVEGYRALFPDVADEFDDLRTRAVSHVVTDAAALTPAVQVVPLAGQAAENLVAVVPGVAIAFGGALACFGVTPNAFDGDPAAWADALDDLIALAPVIVPGHGPLGGEEEVRDLQAYLRACVAAGGDPTAVPDGPWDRWPGRDLDEVNVERAAMLARGDASPPPSILRRLGMA